MRETSGRFSTHSSGLCPARLLHAAARTLWPCLAVALALHVALWTVRRAQADPRTVKPLTTQFVKRQPRLTKPLELKKRPRPRQRALSRQVVATTARQTGRYVASRARSAEVIGSLVQPAAEVLRTAALQGGVLEPQGTAQTVWGQKEAKDVVDTSLEMLDLDALDTGQYHAVVIQSPTDKRDVRGFLHMAIAYSRSMREQDWHEFMSRKTTAIRRLAEAMNAYTSIKTDITHDVAFDAPELQRIPWVYSSTHVSFEVNPVDARCLGRYMVLGGFFSADSDNRAQDSGNAALRQLIIEALRTQGFEYAKDWTFEDLPSVHPIYHCYFDFDQAPQAKALSLDTSRWKDLEGVEINGRLAATISALWLWHAWGDWGRVEPYTGLDPARVLQFGVNMIVFALTQEGSVTNRVMDMVR